MRNESKRFETDVSKRDERDKDKRGEREVRDESTRFWR